MSTPESLTRRRQEIKLQSDLIRMGSIKTCTNCEDWREVTKMVMNENHEVVSETRQKMCTKYDCVPPPDVIVTGCENHEDSIPF